MIKECEKLAYIKDNYFSVDTFGSIDDFEEIISADDLPDFESAEGRYPVGLPSAPTVTEDERT